MSDFYDQEVRDEEMRVLFASENARVKTRQTLVEMLELARECLTIAEIRSVVDDTLGED